MGSQPNLPDEYDMQTPAEPPALPDGDIDAFIRDRVCSRCFGDLQKSPAPGRLWYATCGVCGKEWNYTTIARSTYERRVQQGLAEMGEVRANLPDLFPSPHKGKSDKEILKELGF